MRCRDALIVLPQTLFTHLAVTLELYGGISISTQPADAFTVSEKNGTEVGETQYLLKRELVNWSGAHRTGAVLAALQHWTVLGTEEGGS